METPDTSMGFGVTERVAVWGHLRAVEKCVQAGEGDGNRPEGKADALPAKQTQALRIFHERALFNVATIAPAEPPALSGEVSADMVAREVVTFGGNVFDVWRERCAGLSEQEARDKFSRLMSAALEAGYRETQAILESLQAFQADLKSLSNFVDKLPDEPGR